RVRAPPPALRVAGRSRMSSLVTPERGLADGGAHSRGLRPAPPPDSGRGPPGDRLRLLPLLLSLAAPLLGACVQDVGAGPNLGRCADLPRGTYTYGEIGIGTCLAGPVDLGFFEQDGATWLAVTNADPFMNFGSGSVLLVDWDSVD